MLHINHKNAVVKYKLYKYFKNGSSMLTKCVKTKGPSKFVNFNYGHHVTINNIRDSDLHWYFSHLAHTLFSTKCVQETNRTKLCGIKTQKINDHKRKFTDL